jgi:very-short-patch-repair endonuclease
VIHRSTDLDQQDVTERSGIPTTGVARTLVDIGVPWGEKMAARALDEAQRKGLTDLRAVAGVLHRVARKGRRGVGVMRLILDDRLGWAGITQSQLEVEFLTILRTAGVELPVSQVRIVRRGGRTVARVDFVYLELRLIIELDGERYHTDRGTFRSDRRRQNELIQEGYRVLRFTAWDVFAAPDYVVAQVVAARQVPA